MRVLAVEPGPQFSVADVHRGWVKGLREIGCEVVSLNFSDRLGFSPSILVRDLQRMDAGRPGKWFHVERILRAAGVAANDRRWEQIHAWWYAARTGSGPATVRDGETLPSR